jgi:phosphodiesterase/alkaline phosphatase D-like protein
MRKKPCLWISLILTCALVGNVWAASNTWSGGGGADKSWANPANWGLAACPTLSDDAKITAVSGETDGPLVSTNNPVPTAATVRVGGGTGGTTFGTLRITTGGTLNIGTSAYIGWDSSSVRSGELYMDGGNLKLGVTTPGSGNLYIAHSYTGTQGILKIYAGDINVPGSFIIANSSGTTGTVYLNGGTINAHIFTMGPGTPKMDITAGTLIIDGNVVPTIRALADANTISAYNGAGTIVAEYDTVLPGKTTVVATLGNPEASNPYPADLAVNVALNPTLTWAAGAGNPTHDIYLGTSLADVNNATDPLVLPGRGNQAGRTYNPPTLAAGTTYYWRIDEVSGSIKVKGVVWSFTTLIPSANLAKGPYLIYPGNNTQMTVLWQLPDTQSCALAWGTDTSYSTGSAATTEYGTDHQHKYTITGLTPGTKYYYRVTTAASFAIGSFLAAPAADANSVKFIAYGDTRTNPASHAALISQVNSTVAGDPAYQTLLLHTGDWVESDSEAYWTNEFFNRSYTAITQMQANMQIMGGLGNHELMGTGISIFDKYWPYTYAAPASGRYYSFDYGPVHIAVVDMETAVYNAGSAQLQWLASDLANTTKKWKIVMFHEPAWSATGATNTHANNATAQADIEPILEQNGVQVVFTGHNHYYSRAVVNGIHHVTTGAGGAPFYQATAGQPNVVTYTANKLEFCKVEINGNTLGVTTITDQGEVIDSFYVNKGEPDLTFVQVTDVQIGMEASQNCPGQATRWQAAVDRINMLNPAFVIDTGDHVQSWSVGSPHTASLDSYLSIAASIKPTIPLYHVPGNHDIGDAPDTGRYPSFLSIFPNPFPASSSSSSPWYSFSYGNTLFICIDTLVLKNPSSYVGQDSIEMNWLTNTLQNSSGYTHKIVFTHVPICKTSVTEADDSGGFNMPSTSGNSRAYSNIRAQLLSLFHQYGVEVVLCGHAHVPYYVNDNGLELITTETTTCPLGGLSVDTTGIQIVKIFPDHIEHEYRCLNCFVPSQPLQGDFNHDGVVDLKDFDIFTDYWLDNSMWP